MTPLLCAVFKGRIGVVDVLWAHSKVTLCDLDGRAALHLAVMADTDQVSREEMVKCLLGKRAYMGGKRQEWVYTVANCREVTSSIRGKAIDRKRKKI